MPLRESRLPRCAAAFGKERRTIGFDLSRTRIESLRHHVDATGEVSTTELMASNQLHATADPAELRSEHPPAAAG